MIFDQILFHNVEELEETEKGICCEESVRKSGTGSVTVCRIIVLPPA